MKITLADKLIAYLALLSGLSISAVAVYYSVVGLVSIFAAAAIPIMVMGVVLELSKLVATVWLKMNWSIAPRLIRLYLFVAVMILMMITSMGIFGYLSKAHLDQAVPTGDVVAKVAIIDEKIKTQRDNIEASRRALTQMDTAVDQVMARSTSEQGADKAANLRRSQGKERGNLQNDITKAQKEIAALNEQRAPIAAELRKVEAEVGPIKYIAALLYGDNPDANILEKAVRFVIILIVVIFDPLAVVLLLASQYSFQYFRRNQEGGVVQDQDGTIVGIAPSTTAEEILKAGVTNSNPEDNVPVKQETPEPVIVEETTDVPDIAEKVYPTTLEEIEEFNQALAEAKEKVWDKPVETPPEIEKEVAKQVDPSLEEALLKIIKEGEERGHWDSKDFEPAIKIETADERPGDYVTAPPGTPGEAWDTAPKVNSEQQIEDNLDKIYKASSEKLAKEHRNRSWFQATFPKKDDN